MGQKVDARIFRLGVSNNTNWKLKYIEKNFEESSLYLYKTLEIQKYINQFFGLYKIKIQNCKIFYSNNFLNIFVSFYATTKTIFKIKKAKKKTEFNKKVLISKGNKKLINYKNKFLKKPLQIKTEMKNNSYNSHIFKKVNNYISFQEKFLECLALYTKKKVNIVVSFQNLNLCKPLPINHKKTSKILIKQLKKFSKKPFFKEIFNILVLSTIKRNLAKLLSEFISDQLKLNQLKNDQDTVRRKDNFFLGFLKQALKLIITSSFSRVTGIKIVIKGRFNKAPRAKTRIIQFGILSLQSFNSKIDYYQSTAYTLNGTFGVKVWIREN